MGAQAFLSDGLQGFVSDGLQARNLLPRDAMWVVSETPLHNFLSEISENRRDDNFAGDFGKVIRWARNPNFSGWADDVGGDGSAIWATNDIPFPDQRTTESPYEVSVEDFSFVKSGPIVDWGVPTHRHVGIGGASDVIWHCFAVFPQFVMQELSTVDFSVVRIQPDPWSNPPTFGVTIGGSLDVIWSSDVFNRYFEHSPVDFSQVRTDVHQPSVRIDGFGGDDDFLVSVQQSGPTGDRLRKHSVVDFSVLIDHTVGITPGLPPIGIGAS